MGGPAASSDGPGAPLPPARSGLVPTPRLAALFGAAGAAALAIGALGPAHLARPAGAAAVAAAALAALLDALSAPPARELLFRRVLRGSLRLNRVSWVDVGFAWQRRSGAPRALWWADGAPEAVVPAAPGGRGRLRPGAGPLTFSYRLLPVRRGRVRWSGPRLTVASRLGFWLRRVQAEVALERTVYPGPALAAPAGGAARAGGAPAPGDRGIEFVGVRPYLPGEDARRIHWRATARRDQPVIRELRPERDRRLLIVLDCGRWSAQRLGEAPEAPTRLDAFCAAALAVAQAALDAGDAVGVMHLRSAEAPALFAPRRDRPALARLAERLALLEPSAGDADPAAAVAAVLRVPADGVLWFGEAPSTPDGAPLLRYLPRLARRRRVAFLETAPALPASAEAPGAGGERERNWAQAAQAHARWRREAVALLRRQGVAARDAAAERLGAEALAAYRLLVHRGEG